ncbi:transcription factor-like 5 protein [Nothoprocta perdicaria]|uniref:transcription factor-like 5 protein n=1 Tax=Nothoprocta perdicaria TaxID=30464 RepID=UPI000E1B9896|nr:transcription factor-like 5 protein [Nothoprocta perdicaria]
MSGAAAEEEARGSVPPGAADTTLAPAGPTDASFAEQNLSFTTTDLSLVEMTEMEYTQLQHILCAHMEAPAGEADGEPRLNAAFAPAGGPAEPAPDAGPAAATQPVFPVLCQPPESSLLSSNPCVGHVDFQELRMLLLSEPNPPAAHADKTPGGGGSAEAPGAVRPKGSSAGADGPVPAPEARARSAVRVRLEDRFNSIPAEPPRAPEPHEPAAALSNLVTLIRPPSELIPLHQHPNKCAGLVKGKPAALQFAYPLLAMNAPAGASHAQTSGTSCAVLEAAKHQDLALPRPFCYHQEMEATKQTAGARNKALPEQVWIKVGEDALCKQALSKRSRSRPSPLEPGAERKPLGEIQNTREGAGAAGAQGPWPAGAAAGAALEGVSQRRERHNRMERDRRRRIRICCDELNLLVPFCTADTDKATTLQWTTAFLKYIHERHGDSLKKEFETVFCGKTGRRLKLARSDSFVACPVQENTHGLGDQVV